MRVLVLSRNFPNPALPTMGLWAERLVEASLPEAEPTVIAPLPFVPLFAPTSAFLPCLVAPRRRDKDGIPVHHPRVPKGHGMLLHALDARLNHPFIARLVRRLHRVGPFDLIHAHFIYPDGVIASRLGRELGIPVITTEHADWVNWLEHEPAVRKQVIECLRGITLVTAVSRATAEGIRKIAGSLAEVDLLPNVIDDSLFTLPPSGCTRDPDLVLFAGAARHVKGLDVLVQAMKLVIAKRPSVRLEVLGEPFFRSWKRDEQSVRRLVRTLGLTSRVTFEGRRTPSDVARRMQECAVLVLPSRRETFGAVAAEALACGTPVVSTISGGPEDFVNDDVGRLVPIEDHDALAGAILEVLGSRSRLIPEVLRNHVILRFGKAAVHDRIHDIYRRAIASGAPNRLPA